MTRNKSLHILLTDVERRKVNVVAALMGKAVCEVLRPVLLDFVEREMSERGIKVTEAAKK